jgi:hypothetical protein
MKNYESGKNNVVGGDNTVQARQNGSGCPTYTELWWLEDRVAVLGRHDKAGWKTGFHYLVRIPVSRSDNRIAGHLEQSLQE